MDIAVAVVVAGTMMLIGGAVASRERRRRVAILEAVAREVDPTARPDVAPGGWASNPELTLYTGGVRVHVTMWSSKHGAHTEWRAYVPRPQIASFDVYCETLTSGIGKALGLTVDIVIGTPEFDELFNLKAADEGLARRMWTDERAMHMYGRYSTSRVTGDSSSIHLHRPALAVNAADVRDGIDFVVGLATADLFGIEALHAIPEATVHDGAMPFVIVPGGIRIGAVTIDDTTRTVATSATLEGHFSVEATDPDQVATLPAAARVHAKKLGKAMIVARSGEVSILWPGIETDAERLTGGIELLRALSQPPSLGVFR